MYGPARQLGDICMRRKLLTGWIVIGLLGASAFPFSAPARACACCAEPNTLTISPSKAATVFGRLKAVGATAGALVKGAPGTQREAEERLAATLLSTGGGRLVLRTPKGSLTFEPKGRAWLRSEDITFAAGRGGAGSATLLHTYTVNGFVQLKGDAAALLGVRRARAVLMVRGAGNACVEGGNMRVWYLLIRRGTKLLGAAVFRRQ